MKGLWLFGALCIFLLPLGCTYYLLEQGLGQLEIVLAKQPLEEVLQKAPPDSELAQKLKWMRQARLFGIQELGLTSKGYTHYVQLSRPVVAYNVSASHPLRFEALQWYFPIVGAVPYLGFFDKGLAIGEKYRLERQGYDVILQPVAAYSTLGWFQDPILSPMLEGNEKRDLAELILHEMVHENIYAKGKGDFNENVATFVGQEGAKLFLARQLGQESEEYQRYLRELADRKAFQKFLKPFYRRLEKLYQSSLPEAEKRKRKREIFRQLASQWQKRRLQFRSQRYQRLHFSHWNNALLLSLYRYQGHLDFLEKLFQQEGQGLKKFISLLQQASSQQDPWAFLRERATP